MRLRFAAALVCLGLLQYGCDPGWSVIVDNQSSRTVLIELRDGPARIGYAAPGSVGAMSGGLGVARRGLAVMDANCAGRVALETGDQGLFLLTIAPDGEASVTRVTDEDGMERDVGLLRELGRVCGSDYACPWPTDGWPTEVPRPSSDLEDVGCPPDP